MKSVLISIQPKWVDKITSGKKTIEVRKSRPKIETPFKCYIYCTKHKERLIEVVKKGDDIGWGCIYKEDKPLFIKTFADTAMLGSNGIGKVIGEFVCDRIDKYLCKEYEWDDGDVSLEYRIRSVEGKKTCLDYDEIREYGNEKPLYFWHISDLKIYDKPKELSEFSTYGYNSEYTVKGGSNYSRIIVNPLERPPQSWCYIGV